MYLRHFIHNYMPGMLKPLGLGMLLTLSSLLCTFVIGTVGHLQVNTSSNSCFIQEELNSSEMQLLNSMWYLVIPYLFNVLGYMLALIGSLEFICAQSPHAMKGLVIGIFYAIRGVFEFLGSTVSLIPFLSWHFETSFPS